MTEANADRPQSQVLLVGVTGSDKDILLRELEQQSVAVTELSLGREAVSRSAELFPCLIVMNVAMPDVDGIEVAEMLARYERTRDIPILFVSSNVESDAYRLAKISVAATDTISAPIHAPVLRARLRVMLELAKARGMLRNMLQLSSFDREQEADAETSELVSAGLRDPVSGLATRALLIDRVRFAVTRCIRRQDHLACLHIRFDGYDQFADASGNELATACLRHIGRCIADSVRRSDTCARLGGGDFLVVAESAPSVEVMRIGELLCEQLAEPFSLDDSGKELSLNVSIGISQLSELEIVNGGAEAELLIADLLLERAAEANAKAGLLGPNRCVVSGS